MEDIFGFFGLRVAVALAAVVLALLPPASACSCSEPDVCRMLESPVAFLGEVLEGGITAHEDPWYASSRTVRFRVLEWFRGAGSDAKVIEVKVYSPMGMCAAIPFVNGERYLVRPVRLEKQLVSGDCYYGMRAEDAQEAVELLREQARGDLPLHIRGSVFAGMPGSSRSSGSRRPLAGVRVEAAGSGKLLSALTDSQGRYRLVLPSAGEYRVKASFPPYRAEARKVTVRRGSCSVADFPMQVDTSITGHVRDARGQPLDAQVALIALDVDTDKQTDESWFDTEYTKGPDRVFRFKNVPLGRYLLMFNPEGPGGTRYRQGLPLEQTYYPGASARSEAREIVLAADAMHLAAMDLVVGKPVPQRTVRVSVKMPDGRPVTFAKVMCSAEGVPRTEGSTFEAGTAELIVPADRPLHLEIRDGFGRRWSRAYTKSYGPGPEPITETFVVEP